MSAIRFLSLTAGIFLTMASLVAEAGKRDRDGHVLMSEWKNYYEAVEKDLPQTQEKVLKKLVEKSADRHLPWDFYDAVRKYCSAVRSYDWKRYGTVTDSLKTVVADYGYPVVLWNLSDYPLYEEIPDPAGQEIRKDLLRNRNDQFYGNDRFITGGNLPEAIQNNIGNDYEYLLWSMLMRGHAYRSSGDRDSLWNFARVSGIMAEYYAGRYPEAAYIEFLEAAHISSDSTSMRKAALDSFVEKYRDKGIRLLAMEELLRMKFNALEKSHASSEAYRELREECAGFEKALRAERDEASLTEVCTYPARLAETLDFSRITALVKKNTDTLQIGLRNLDKVVVRLMTRDSTVIFRRSEDNPVCSYYVPDTIFVKLPAANDGDYIISCSDGDVKTDFAYRRYTLAMACQQQKQGLAVFLTDFKSGKPVKKADVSIYYKDSLVRYLPGTVLDGFTVLDAEMKPDDWYYVRCSYTDDSGLLRQTEKQYVSSPGIPHNDGGGLSCMLLKNMAAFHPGDTLEYKAILFGTDTAAVDGRVRYSVWTGKEPVIVGLQDASRNTIARDTLYANPFGSVSGRFALPEDRRNGTFTLYVETGGRILASDVLTVDEFVLPSFYAEFEDSGKIFFPGDTVTVRGRVGSYAGLSLAAAQSGYTVSLSGRKIQEGGLEIAPDGSFSLSFLAGKGKYDRYYRIAVKVTDATGESHEFGKSIVVDDCYFSAEIGNAADGSIEFAGGGRLPDAEADSADFYNVSALEGDFAVVSFDLRNAGFEPVPGKISYQVYYKGEPVVSGDAEAGEKTWIDLSSWPSGIFRLKAAVDVRGREKTCICDLVKTADDDDVLGGAFAHFIKVLPSDGIEFQFGASSGPVWAAVQLFGDENECLISEMVHLEGTSGSAGSLRTLSYDYEDSYPDNVRLLVSYFRDGVFHMFSRDFERRHADLMLPLSFSRFTDKAMPGGNCVYEIQTLPGVECAVSVFDVSTEVFRANPWSRYVPYHNIPYVYVTSSGGGISGSGSSPAFRFGRFGEESAIPFQMVSDAPRFSADLAGPAAGNTMLQESVMAKSVSVEQSSAADVTVRKNFSEALAFRPFLYSDENGKILFEFPAGDKLSTYAVSVFAHDKSMSNNVLRKDMQVSLPVTVSVMQPGYLYSGDRYDMSVSLSNVSDSDSEGTLSVFLYDGEEYRDLAPAMVMSRPVKIPEGSAIGEIFPLDVPSGIDTLGIKVIYRASEGFSDGIFVTVPVFPPVQTLYESHSALLLSGMSRDSLYSVLRSEFVNVSGYGAVSREISISDMLEEAVPDSIAGADAPDVISVAEAYFSARLSSVLRGEAGRNESVAGLAGELLSYQNAGGGFAWLKGGPSSPLMTSVILEYLSVLDRRCPDSSDERLAEAVYDAVKYLDSCYFSDKESGYLAGSTDMCQYLYVRSLYSSVPLTVSVGRRELKEFASKARKYLLGKESDAPGYILYKARRAMTVMNFLSSEGAGDSYLRSVNIKTSGKLRARLSGYMESLKEYAVAHKSGGCYYPNAVMPFRGLLENELYAHSMLCTLMSVYAASSGDMEAAGIADGIRLWIMVQKETQDWDNDPAFMLALNAVSEGSPDLLASEVLILTQKYERPFREIKAAGNDMSVRCRYFKADDTVKDTGMPGYREIREGEVLHVGDKVLAVYDLWSAENRSFVRLTVPRYASMRPENQLSGYYGGLWRPGIRGFAPYSYREVKSDRSVWYIDVLAEEDTRITESLIVTQSGLFSCPVAGTECLYAPHYRANDGARPQLETDK